MEYFAQLDENNKVIQVVVVDEKEAPDEKTGIAFCQSLYGAQTVWKLTSYNTRGNVYYDSDNVVGNKLPFRKNYAVVGSIYDVDNDAFYNEQPYPSWMLNQTTYLWEAPTPMPSDDKNYKWVEADLNWQVITPTVG